MRAVGEGPKEKAGAGGSAAARWSAAAGGLAVGLVAAGCAPTVRVETPREPITINLNVNLTAEVKVRLERQAEQDIANSPDIF